MPQPYGSAQQLSAVFVAVADSPLIADRWPGGSDGQECPQASRPPEEEREPRQASQRL